MCRIGMCASVALLAGGLLLAGGAVNAEEGAAAPGKVLEFTVQSIEGEDVPLSRYAGQVLLIVNVASQCGLTPQYAQLVELDRRYRGRGLRVLGFPANDFGQQEPGSNAEIKQFCTDRFEVAFDMFAKIAVKGDEIHPLYALLTSTEKHPKTGGDIKWNFTKFLVGRDGAVIARFEPRTRPDDPEVIEAIETALEAGADAAAESPEG